MSGVGCRLRRVSDVERRHTQNVDGTPEEVGAAQQVGGGAAQSTVGMAKCVV